MRLFPKFDDPHPMPATPEGRMNLACVIAARDHRVPGEQIQFAEIDDHIARKIIADSNGLERSHYRRINTAMIIPVVALAAGTAFLLAKIETCAIYEAMFCAGTVFTAAIELCVRQYMREVRGQRDHYLKFFAAHQRQNTAPIPTPA